LTALVFSQKTYTDSLQDHINEYVKTHEVVKGNDRMYLQFYPINENYRIIANFENTPNTTWFKMATSGTLQPLYRIFGKIKLIINDTLVTLFIYQSQNLMSTDKYKDHLFIPFTDMSSGEETYEGGRYIDLTMNDIKNNKFVIDFNKAYNPYCAYVSNVYNCPIPPKENRLKIFVKAGEKKYAKSH
jgi:uncharacterized protein (DUF1684 family)